ncbi:restriction endonuclease subunit S [Enterococcus sp. BWM-S5]|uniref:Restriction endonuclease subunit S n=1 Tax=Enterococcus larvae TaxID=2794352 RepID=A0ABS4CMD9_9ENTE|nr:restriction endonuclease subunit S [Enterococcus larvae]MBP1047276.1 restriction endonuclease subunit S [Enterococcus larvae]
MSKQISFSKVKIKNIGKVVTGKTPSTKQPEYYGGNFLFISPTELHGNYLIQDSVKKISQLGMNAIKSNTISGLSILVGCIGWDMGNVSICTETCATNQQINSITLIDERKYNPYYIYYWLKGKKDYLFSLASVTRTPILSKSTFQEIEIPVPSKSIQDNISNMLLSLDKKIMLNDQIVYELENLTRTIYDYWFIGFNFPDENKKPYQSSGGKMIYSKDLNHKIPENWEVKKLEDLELAVIRGVTYNKNDISIANSSSIGILRGTNISNNNININDLVYINSDLVSKKQKLNPFDLIITMSSGSKDHVGKNGFYYCDNKNMSYGAFLSKIDIPKILKFYIGMYFQSSHFRDYLNKQILGTSINNVTNAMLTDIKLAIPDKQLLQNFNTMVQPIFYQIQQTIQEKYELEKLRDWLLPILMNGQVTVDSNNNTL